MSVANFTTCQLYKILLIWDGKGFQCDELLIPMLKVEMTNEITFLKSFVIEDTDFYILIYIL